MADDSDERSDAKWIILVVIVFLGLGVSVWASLRGDPNYDRAKMLARRLNSEEGRQLPEEQRFEMLKELGHSLEALKPEQREVVQEQRAIAFVDRYFAMTKEEQLAHLDKEIDRWEGYRKRREAERGNANNNPAPPTPPRPPESSATGSSGNTSNSSQSTNQSGSGYDGSKGRKARLDSTTPEQRFKMSEYRRQMSDRRKQRGLSNSYMPRG